MRILFLLFQKMRSIDVIHCVVVYVFLVVCMRDSYHVLDMLLSMSFDIRI